MSRKTWRWLLGVLLAVGLASGWTAWTRPARPVNILLITLDTTRADRIGCYGYAGAETPTLDALAKRGVRFERAYAPAPMTSPSHTSLFTGLWPPEHGVFTNGQIALEAGIPTVAESLKRRGYDCAAFVAAFVLQAKFGLARGFSTYDDDLSSAAGGGDELHRYRDGRIVVDSAIRWLRKHSQQNARAPFLCWVHLYDPHEPYLPHRDEFGDRFDERLYDGELAYTDLQVGRLLKTLEELRLAGNTAIVVVGDHGESLGEHGEQTHGYMLHDSTLRVPLIIADPRRRSSAAKISTPVSLIDLYPTLLELGGTTPPKETRERSLSPALRGEPLAARVCYSQTEEPYLQAFWSPLQGLTTERFRYVRTTIPELYDLAADPKELVNLAADQPDRVSELDGELAALEATFQRHAGARVALSDREQRALESLGYAGGGTSEASDRSQTKALPDIKLMIGYLEQMQQANEWIDHGKFAEAAEALEPLAKDVPNFLRARLNLGLCRLQLKQYDDAVRWLEAALEVDPNSDRAHDMLGYCYLRLNRLDDAARQFQRLLELRPDSETGHLFLGEIAQKQDQPARALRYFEQVLQINPRSVAARRAIEELRGAKLRP